MTKIILDTDLAMGDLGADVDDGFALALAIADPDIDLLAVTTVNGNTDVHSATRLSHRLLDKIGYDVPVYQGAVRPLLRKPNHPIRDSEYEDVPAALVSRGYLEELTAAFSDQTSEWDKSATEANTYDGKLWAVPLATSTQLLYYNKDILDKAGLMAPSADPDKRISWEALKSEAAKAQSNGGAKYGFMFGQMDRYYQLEPLFVEAGGGTGISGDDGLTPDFESNGWTKALEYYKSLFADGVSPRGQEEMQDEFYAGNVAFMQDGTWAIDKASKTDFNWGVAASPTFEGTDAKTPTGSWSLGMNPYSDSKEAAAIFMNWMACQDGGQISVYQPAPDLPASKKARERYFTRDVFQTDAGKNAVNLINYELENTAVIRPQTIGYVEFEEVLNRAFADVRNGADPTTSLKNATTQLNTAWAAYK